MSKNRWENKRKEVYERAGVAIFQEVERQNRQVIENVIVEILRDVQKQEQHNGMELQNLRTTKSTR